MDAVRTAEVMRELEKLYPEARPELNFSNPYETLVATMLSAQCTDKQVNKVTPAVFRDFPDARAMAAIDADTLYDSAEERDHVMQGSVMATLSRKLLTNSIGVLFDLLGKLGNKKAIKSAANFLSTSIYILFRYLHQSAPEQNSEGFFSVAETKFVSGISLIDMYVNEGEFLEGVYSERKNENFPDLSHDAMTKAYPGTYQSLLQIIHTCGERLNHETEKLKSPN